MLRKILVAFICAFNLFIGCLFLAPVRTRPVWDLPSLYFAGRLVRSGHISQLYNRPAYAPLIAEVRQADPKAASHAGYYNRPAWEAPLFLPLAFFSFQDASRVSVAVNFILLALVIWLVPHWFSSPWLTRPWLLSFLPFLYTIAFGQDTLLLALVVGYGLYLARQGRDTVSGVILALASFKPQVIFLLPLAMIGARRWRIMRAFVGTGMGLLLLSFLLVGPDGFRGWIADLRSPNTDAVPLMMGNLRSLALHLGTPVAAAAGLVAIGAFGATLYRRSFLESASAALLMSLLFSPHTYAQDYSVLAVAALVAFPVVLRYAIVLPWLLFLPSNNETLSPFICLSLASLVGLAIQPLIWRWFIREGKLEELSITAAVC